jgi:predicted DNA-binding protein
MKRIHISLADDHVESLKSLSSETGAPVAELIRRSVAAYVAGRRKIAAAPEVARVIDRTKQRAFWALCIQCRYNGKASCPACLKA